MTMSRAKKNAIEKVVTESCRAAELAQQMAAFADSRFADQLKELAALAARCAEMLSFGEVAHYRRAA
jgi:hypothetical protein